MCAVVPGMIFKSRTTFNLPKSSEILGEGQMEEKRIKKEQSPWLGSSTDGNLDKN